MACRRSVILGASGAFLCGCSGALHRLPSVGSGSLGLAAEEVDRGALPPRRFVPDDEVRDILRRVRARVVPAARPVCAEMGAGTCEWSFKTVDDRSMNASAGPGGIVTINRGIVEYARNDDEVALVLAHEIAHQAANHVGNSQRNTAIGATIGALLLGIAAAYAGQGSPYAQSAVRTAAETGANAGGALGRISFSKEQEREADYIAAVILHRAGYDLAAARGFLVTLARASTRRETGLLDTHPAGPERLAAYDLAVAEIRANGGALPARAG